jgi:hypothetical protein
MSIVEWGKQNDGGIEKICEGCQRNFWNPIFEVAYKRGY